MATDRLIQEPDGTITRIYASGARHSINPALPGALSAAGAAAALSKGIDLSKIDPDVRKLIESYGPEQQRADDLRLQEDYIESLRQAQAEGFVPDPEQQALIRAADQGKILTTYDEIYGFDPTLTREFTDQPGSLDFLNRRADLRQAFESAAKSGGYSTDVDNWVAYAENVGLEKALAEYAKVNPGVGGLRTRAFDQISGITAERALADVPLTPVGGQMTPVPTVGVPGALSQFNAQDIYGQGFVRPQAPMAPVQRPIYPQIQMGVPTAQPLINQVARPTLTPQAAYVTQAPLIVEPGARPTLDTQTAYIGVPTGMKEGGLASAARQVAAEGRRGDSMLVHMTPGEVAGLQSLAQMMGGSLTVNPDTGLPEANFFKKILPLVAAVAAPYLAPVAAGLGVSAPLLVGGLTAAGTMLGGGNLSEGLKMGLTAGTGAYLTSGASGTGGMMGSNPLGVGGDSTFNVANTFGAKAAVNPSLGGVKVGAVDTTDLGAAFYPGDPSYIDPSALQPAAAVNAGAGAATAKTAAKSGMGLSEIALPAYLAMGSYGAIEQNKLAKEEMDRLRAEEEEKKRRYQLAYERSGLRSLPMNIPTVTGAGGGLVAMAGGGMTYMEAGGTTGPTGTPRDVTGTGDGMSDSVPATIEGVQEARLADGEFVIPADVVADIGNGSSDAGSKKLYDMMDRIRKARHGTTEQPPEIDAEALMPA